MTCPMHFELPEKNRFFFVNVSERKHVCPLLNVDLGDLLDTFKLRVHKHKLSMNLPIILCTLSCNNYMVKFCKIPFKQNSFFV